MHVFTHIEHSTPMMQVFFVEDQSTPGWFVVLKKEARGRRITPTETDHILGQEESQADREAFPQMVAWRRARGDENFGSDAMEGAPNGRRRQN